MRAVLVLAAFLLAAPAAAQALDFCSDRPGLTTGTCIAPSGTAQLETAFAEWSTSRAGGVRTEELAIGSSRLRIGLGGTTDLHFSVVPFVRSMQRAAGERTVHRGGGDIGVAVKHRLTGGDAPLAIAVMPFVKIPTARRPIGNGEWEGGLLLPVDASLGQRWSLTLTPEVDWNADGDGNGRHARLAVAASVGVGLARRWSASLNAMVGRERDGGSTAREAAGALAIAFQVRPGLQLDAQADVGLGPATPDFKLSSGMALRF